MTKYLILLRGINVGGNNIIKMADLKSCLEEAGFSNVKTYIQSGNVIVESSEKSKDKLVDKIEHLLSKKFKYNSKIVLRTQAELEKIIRNAPKWWNGSEESRHYLLFIKEPMSAKDALKECGEPKEGIENAQAGEGVIYHSALIKDIAKTTFAKLPAKAIYKQMTIRNYNTSVKLLEMMKE